MSNTIYEVFAMIIINVDDPFSEPTVVKAPTAGRFQPKAKPRPKRGPLPAVKSTKEPSVTSISQDSVSVQSNGNVEKKSDAPISSSFTDVDSLGKPPKDGNLSTEAREVSGSAVTGDLEIDVSIPVGGINLSVDSSTELQLPPNIVGLSPNAAGFPAETPTLDASNVQNEGELSGFPDVSFIDAPSLKPCKPQTVHDQSIDKTLQDSESYKGSFVCDDADIQIDVEQLGVGDFSCFDSIDMMSEGAAASGKRAVKFQPKPKAQSDRLKAPTEAGSHHPHGSELHSETLHLARDSSIHAGQPDTVSDLSHMRLDSEFSIHSSVYQADFVGSEETDQFMTADLPQQGEEHHGEDKSYDALDSSAKSVDEGFLSGFDVNENGYELFDGINGEFHDNINSHNEAPYGSASNRDENNDVVHLAEESSQKKRPRKSKKVASENDKPARRRRKATQNPAESTEKPPKKFPRGTRRKRCVDKSLLEAPEDELDLQRVPIRELILLAEHKERQAKKEAATTLPSLTSERTDNTLSEDRPYDDEGYGFDQDDAFDNPSTSEVQKDTGYFNYQSFMQREPRARWTKQDTELFYKGISQFGSDLSMVQQLFPGLTRHHIKLKYKKEERQNPMRLHDALCSRTQDLSHFELVIGRLKEQAARDGKADIDDSVYEAGEAEGPEEVVNSHEDVAKPEQNEEDKVADQEPDKHLAESPPKSYHSEEEDFDWSEYKSEL
ncbi:hypothetical protein BVRB_3g051000 [Beta vulgaris subsp. vulgaris]|uniref:Myb-like domain-containing protein n=1 Tax=Beta vulgaris subsp. vulgaris TaxID=3555 RepID=A0A0J8CSA5_BETVV|nr:hypothetical protein BVRB_3g051000 [Beta vulgaris subsp. vulgaris]